MITYLEPPDTNPDETAQGSNVAVAQDGNQQQETPAEEAGAEQAVGGADGTQQTPEPTIKVGDREVPVSQVEKALKDYGNDQAWQEKNRHESEELNARRERLRRMELLEPMLEANPEVVKQLFIPKTQRNFDAELAAHYSTKPDALSNPTEMSSWELKRDQLLGDKSRVEIETRIEAVRSQEEARMHNERVEVSARELFVKSGKLADNEFERMTEWILQRRQFDPRTGKAYPDAYDVAYRALFADRFERDIRAAATQRVVAPLTAGTSGGRDAGVTQRTPPPSPSERDDADFVRASKELAKGNYTKL